MLKKLFGCCDDEQQKKMNQIKIEKQRQLKKKVETDLEFIKQTQIYPQISKSRKEEIRNVRSAHKLHQMLLNKQTSCEELVVIFGEITLTEGYSLNLLTECLVKEAYIEAIEKDKLGDNEKQSVFFGIPTSIKDNTIYKNTDATMGCISHCNKPHLENGVFADFLEKELGCLIICKTNIPQALLLNESLNTIFGKSLNPLNIDRSTGGSSGGEGGIVALGGSVIGIGNDIGGSVRIPALFTGLVGFKSTENRTSYKGFFYNSEYDLNGDLNIIAVPGLISNNVTDQVAFYNSLFDSQIIKNNEFYRLPIPWDGKMYSKYESSNEKVRICYMANHEYLNVCDSIQRGMKELVDKLKTNSKYELVALDSVNNNNQYFDFKQIVLDYMGMKSAVGQMRDIKSLINNEKFIEEYDEMVKASHMPQWLRPLVSYLYKLSGELRLSEIISIGSQKDYYQYLQLAQNQQIHQQKLVNMFTKLKIDAMLFPGSITPAIKHHDSQKLFIQAGYTFCFNLLKVPTIAIPVTHVQVNEQYYCDSKYSDKISAKICENMQNSVDLPVGLQMVCLPGQDEKLLAIAKDIETIIEFEKKPNDGRIQQQSIIDIYTIYI